MQNVICCCYRYEYMQNVILGYNKSHALLKYKKYRYHPKTENICMITLQEINI